MEGLEISFTIFPRISIRTRNKKRISETPELVTGNCKVDYWQVSRRYKLINSRSNFQECIRHYRLDVELHGYLMVV